MSEKQQILIEKPIQRIICGDNLESLKAIADNSVDLCYIDPPFFTSKKYEVVFNDGAEIRQFNDRWITSEKDSEEDPKRSSKDINVYLEFMRPRIEEIYRVLKPTGSFYLHCDKNANAYLRIMCDKIFGVNNFVNEIIWHYSGTGNPSKRFKQKHDNIYLYSKSDCYTFNPPQDLPTNESTIKRYNMEDENGKYKTWNTHGVIRKVYMKPLTIDDVWDISVIGATGKERLGYPTQKPEALLERIIKASSNEGDVVMDTFCGCGSAVAVAKRLNRQFIGMDVSPTAVRLIAKRLGMPINSIEGLPITKEEISELDGNEFQNFIIREFGGFSGKRGADGGIDGYLGKLLIQVKKFKAGRMHLDEFSGMLLREARKEGVFIALEYSKDFRAEVARLKAENKIIVHYFDVQDIIDKKHYDLVAKHIPKKGLEKYDAVKTEYEMKE